MTSRRLRLAALVATTCLTVVACGGDDSDDTTNPTNPTSADSDANDPAPTNTDPDDAAITIEDFEFAIPASVPAGSVAIQNNDAAPHTLTDDAGSFDIAVDANASTTAEIPAGTYEVHCEIHSTMTGSLTVA